MPPKYSIDKSLCDTVNLKRDKERFIPRFEMDFLRK